MPPKKKMMKDDEQEQSMAGKIMVPRGSISEKMWEKIKLAGSATAENAKLMAQAVDEGAQEFGYTYGLGVKKIKKSLSDMMKGKK
jgi:hypothetical protein